MTNNENEKLKDELQRVTVITLSLALATVMLAFSLKSIGVPLYAVWIPAVPLAATLWHVAKVVKLRKRLGLTWRGGQPKPSS